VCVHVSIQVSLVVYVLRAWGGVRGVSGRQKSHAGRGPLCPQPRTARAKVWISASQDAPYLRSKCTGWTPTFQTRPSGRPADACAGDSGRRRVSGHPARLAVSYGVLWTVGSETTPGTEEGAVSSGSGVPSLPLPALATPAGS
jgi:hypothetical protein